MASVKDLFSFGWQVMFGLSDVSPPATFSVPAGDPVSVGEARSQKWQRDAWRLWKWVGELHYPSTRLSRQTSQLEWRVRVNNRELSPTSAKNEMEKVTAGLGPQGATYLLALNDMVAGDTVVATTVLRSWHSSSTSTLSRSRSANASTVRRAS